MTLALAPARHCSYRTQGHWARLQGCGPSAFCQSANRSGQQPRAGALRASDLPSEHPPPQARHALRGGWPRPELHRQGDSRAAGRPGEDDTTWGPGQGQFLRFPLGLRPPFPGELLLCMWLGSSWRPRSPPEGHCSPELGLGFQGQGSPSRLLWLPPTSVHLLPTPPPRTWRGPPS